MTNQEIENAKTHENEPFDVIDILRETATREEPKAETVPTQEPFDVMDILRLALLR